jgi:small GTP-binding protein
MAEIKVKICLLGNPAVRKTSLIRKFVYDVYSDKYIGTLGTKVSKKVVNIGDKEVTMLIWDLMGEHEFRRIQLTAFKGTQGALIVCDLTRKETLEGFDYWPENLFEVTGKVPIIFLGNKNDLPNKEISEDDIRPYAEKYGTEYYLTSAKTGEHVEEAFVNLAKKIVERM